jgi:hypothetical protein
MGPDGAELLGTTDCMDYSEREMERAAPGCAGSMRDHMPGASKGEVRRMCTKMWIAGEVHVDLERVSEHYIWGPVAIRPLPVV